jgi:hypothetical protein
MTRLFEAEGGATSDVITQIGKGGGAQLLSNVPNFHFFM